MVMRINITIKAIISSLLLVLSPDIMAGAQTNKAIINDFSRGITIGSESLSIRVPKNMLLPTPA